MRKRMVVLFLTLFSLVMMSVDHAQAGGMAIIVNNSNKVDDVSLGELEKIFKMEKRYWDGGKKIYVILPVEGTREKTVILEKIYKMDSGRLKKFLLQKIFQGEITAFPKTLTSNQSIKYFVRKIPHAIGIIDADDVDDSVKVLRLNGKLPEEDDYMLTGNKG